LHLGERFGEKIEFYNSSAILDRIELLEANKVECEPFERNDLKGFYKTHHGIYASFGYSVVMNIRQYWYKKDQIRSERKGEFDQIVSEYKENVSAILNTMHSHALAYRDLKGEWIILAQKNGIKYYLCLAAHKEGDPVIYETKLKRCLAEFPELIY